MRYLFMLWAAVLGCLQTPVPMTWDEPLECDHAGAVPRIGAHGEHSRVCFRCKSIVGLP